MRLIRKQKDGTAAPAMTRPAQAPTQSEGMAADTSPVCAARPKTKTFWGKEIRVEKLQRWVTDTPGKR
jgi:hypothetical protein